MTAQLHEAIASRNKKIKRLVSEKIGLVQQRDQARKAASMDRVSETIKKIDELIEEVTADQRLKKPRYSPLRVLTIVRKVITRSKPQKN